MVSSFQLGTQSGWAQVNLAIIVITLLVGFLLLYVINLVSKRFGLVTSKRLLNVTVVAVMILVCSIAAWAMIQLYA